jgi:hypothetical protein
MFRATSRVKLHLLSHIMLTSGLTSIHSIPSFLTRSSFDKYMREAKGKKSGSCGSSSSMPLGPLVDSVMAFGYHAFLKSTQRFVSPEKKRKADYYSSIALKSRECVLQGPNSLLKLQVPQVLTPISCSDANKLDRQFWQWYLKPSSRPKIQIP